MPKQEAPWDGSMSISEYIAVLEILIKQGYEKMPHPEVIEKVYRSIKEAK